MRFRLAPRSMTLDDLERYKFEFSKFGIQGRAYSLDGADVYTDAHVISRPSQYGRLKKLLQVTEYRPTHNQLSFLNKTTCTSFWQKFLDRVSPALGLWLLYVNEYFFTARCTLVQSAVLRSHVVCLSVRLSVTLVNCDHIGWNSSKIISPLVSLGRSLFATPTRRVCSKGNTPKFSPEQGWGAEKVAFGVQKL